MVKIIAALSILNSSGATKKVAALVVRASCSGTSSALFVYGINYNEKPRRLKVNL